MCVNLVNPSADCTHTNPKNTFPSANLTAGLFVRAVNLHFSKTNKIDEPRISSADRNSIIGMREHSGLTGSSTGRVHARRNSFTRHKLMFHFNHVLSSPSSSSSSYTLFAVYCLFYETVEFEIWIWKTKKRKEKTSSNNNNGRRGKERKEEKTENSFINNQIAVHHLVQPSTLYIGVALEAFRDSNFCVLIVSRVRLVCICHRQMDSEHPISKSKNTFRFGNLLGKSEVKWECHWI